MEKPSLSTTQKAQAVNFDRNQYGTFAEIGAARKWRGGSFVSAARPGRWPRA